MKENWKSLETGSLEKKKMLLKKKDKNRNKKWMSNIRDLSNSLMKKEKDGKITLQVNMRGTNKLEEERKKI
jgi:hypothetical protein